VTNVKEYISLVENYDWSNPAISYIIIALKIEKRCAVIIANGIRNVGYKAELSEQHNFPFITSNYFHIRVFRKK
jgi:hypothetical protein